MIKTIGIRNFKSFDKVKVALGPLSVLVGANASGKTNFVDAFRFTQECINEGISIAVGRRFGSRGVRCRRRYDRTTELSVEVEPVDPEPAFFVELIRADMAQGDLHVAKSFSYCFRFEHMDGDFVVTWEEFLAALAAQPQDQATPRQISFTRRESAVRVEWPRFGEEPVLIPQERKDSLFLSSGFFSTASSKLADYVAGWSFFDIDPEEARTPRLAESVVALGRHAENLPLLLDLVSDKEDQDNYARGQRIQQLMQSMVPSFESWKTEQMYDGRIGFRIREVGTRSPFPPELTSDGTIFLLSLLTALLAHRKPTVIFIEEPERGLHPQLMESLVDLMRQVSTRTQVIATTHSPDLVRHLRPDEVYMVDKVDRATKVVRASSVEKIDQFLQHFTIDELWLQGYLQAGLPI
jgi:predicted ATPase